MTDADDRPDPDALLALAAREGRGRLKVFLGAAPGVGKTYEMLSEGAALRREGRDVVVDSGRDLDPFVVHVDTAAGEERVPAAAVVDASGTWTTPNPLGADGYPAAGERAHASRITYGIPDLHDETVRSRYAGRHVAVAGTGASAPFGAFLT